jgi:hypothetical protein
LEPASTSTEDMERRLRGLCWATLATAERVRQGTSTTTPNYVLPGAPIGAQIALLEDFLARHCALDRAERLIAQAGRSWLKCFNQHRWETERKREAHAQLREAWDLHTND